ncbi:hypothetical protein F2Q68_00011509 [Brassica cretica]|uniref:Uncharacterized protein n=1 Tax=Brassica cretica TaxID=69181 RepID=A0A8S9KTP7_BRACR|nr:hypothetical protein F2Q68_00011509 [Brassica cretica]
MHHINKSLLRFACDRARNDSAEERKETDREIAVALPRRQPPTETSPDRPTEPPIGRDLPFRRGEEGNRERCHRFPWWRRATDREAVVSRRRRQPPTETQPWRRTVPSIASDFAFRRSEERKREKEMKEKKKCEGR